MCEEKNQEKDSDKRLNIVAGSGNRCLKILTQLSQGSHIGDKSTCEVWLLRQ